MKRLPLFVKPWALTLLVVIVLLSFVFTQSTLAQSTLAPNGTVDSKAPRGILDAKTMGKNQSALAKKAKLDPNLQPIAFSHELHAGKNQIDCQYCHLYARRSNSAGVPPVYVCAGCHQAVATDRPEVKKVMDYWKRQEPIPWVKVFDLPDFVRFPHQKHVNAQNKTFPEGVPCQTCHGEIQTMAVVKKQDKRFGTMGWCLECHLSVPGVKNAKRAIAAIEAPHKIKNGQHPKGYARPLLTDCLTCHY